MHLQLNGRIGAVGVLILALTISVLSFPQEYLYQSAKRSHSNNGHHISRRSFIEVNCKGIYDKSYFARLDRVCEDCYNLFREPQLHRLCRENCFTSDYFEGCIDVLQLKDEKEKFKGWIKQLHGADPSL